MSLFKKKTGTEPEMRAEKGAGKNQVAQLVLLVLIAVFGYLYFFTSLIVPHEKQPETTAAPASTPQVTQSMPPRPADTAAAPAPTAAAPTAAAPTAAAPTAAAPVAPGAAQKPADTKPAPVAPPKTAAPAKAPAAPPAKKEELKPAKPAEQKQAAPVPKKEEAKPVKGPEKVAAAKNKQSAQAAPKTVKKEQKTVAAEEQVKRKADAASYTILVGEFAAADVAAVEAKLVKHKIKSVKNVAQKNRQMTRLYYGAYSDYDSYSAALEKLKQSAKSSFAVEKDGRYSIYAGSFGSAPHAAAEKKRLADKGIKVELQQVSLPISTVQLSAGPFSDKAAADKAASQLKKEGLTVKVIPKGK